MFRVTVLTKFEQDDPTFTVNSQENLNKMLNVIFEAGYEATVYKIRR